MTKTCGKCKTEKDLNNFADRRGSQDGKQSYCRECSAIYAHEMRRNQPEKIKTYREKSRTKHKEKWNARQVMRYHADIELSRKKGLEQYYANYEHNKELHRVNSQRYYWNHREERAEESRVYRIKNAERIAERLRRYQLENPEKMRELARRYQARKRNATIETVDYEAIVIRDGLLCHLCNKEVKLSELQFDHVIPLSRGGAHSMGNIRIAHAYCNARKHNKLLPSGCFADE